MVADWGDVHGRRSYEVRHRTTYNYDDFVTTSFARSCLRPRSTDHQQVVSNRIEVLPGADVLTEHVDYFGNYSHYIEIRTRHTQLQVAKTSVVDVTWPKVDVQEVNQWTVAQAALQLRDPAVITPAEHASYTLPSDLVVLSPEVQEYAAQILPPDRPLGDALVDLYESIYRDFSYQKGATSVTTTLAEVLQERAGVCQDFAHLAAGCLRVAGLPGRYVSGYIETRPPEGRPKLEGSDATHAWTSTRLPDGRWVDLDPTNNHFADSRYIVTAWGRDFRDVSPLKGVIFTESKKSTLKVAVDVIPLERLPV